MTKRITLFVIALVSAVVAFAQPVTEPKVNRLAPNDWRRFRDMDTMFHSATAFSLFDTVHVVTGDTGYRQAFPRHTQRFHKLDTLNGTHASGPGYWIRKKDFGGTGRIGAVSFVLNNNAYVGGGRRIERPKEWGSHFFDSSLKDMWRFNPFGDAGRGIWTQVADIPAVSTVGRAHAVAFVMNISGTGLRGVVGTGYEKKYKIFDSISFKQAYFADFDSATAVNTPLPAFIAKSGANVMSPDEFDLFVGKDFHRYDPTTNTWSSAAVYNMPASATPRYGGVAFVLKTDKDKAYVGLGNDGDDVNFLRDFWRYDPTAFPQWQKMPDFPYTGRSYSVAWSSGFIGIVGMGFDGDATRDFYEFNGKSNTWDRFYDFPMSDSARFLQAYTNNEAFSGYLMGGMDLDTAYKSCWRYRIDTIKIEARELDSLNICNTDMVRIGYKANNAMFYPSNKFIVEFSDSTGSFGDPIIIDTIAGTALIDTLDVQLNKYVTLTNGSKYRYRVRSTNPRFNGQPSLLNYTVREAPIFVGSPNSTTSCVGTNASFTVELNFYAYKPKITWWKNGVQITSDTTTKNYWIHTTSDSAHGIRNDSLVVYNVKKSDTGLYYAVVDGYCSPSATSDGAILTVDSLPPPKLTYQQNDTAICGGEPIKLVVKATGKSLNYRWIKIDSTIRVLDTIVTIDTVRNGGNINDAFTDTLVMTSVNEDDTGWYYVHVFEDCGTDTFSKKFKLSINQKVAVLEHAINDIDTFELVDVKFGVKAKGRGLKYQWYKDANPISNGGKYSGTTTDSLTIHNLRLQDGGLYRVKITDTCNNFVFSNFTVLQIDPTPQITVQPEDTLEVCAGDDAQFKITASGADLTYIWQKFDNTSSSWIDLPNDTNRTIDIVATNSANQGLYRCKVTSGSTNSTVYSQPGFLKVKPIPAKCTLSQPTNTTLIISNCGTLTCTELTYQWYFNGVYQQGYEQSAVYNHTTNEPGMFTLRVICDGCYAPLSDPHFFIPRINSVAGIFKGELKVYPNPVKGDQLTVEVPNVITDEAELKVYDVLGKLISEFKVSDATKFTINTAAWAQGVYHVVLNSNDAQFTTKVIKP